MRDVSATLGELDHWIKAAYPAASRGGSDATYLIETAEAALELSATPGPLRRIALLALPTLRLEYRFRRGDRDARAELLGRLDMFMHRGGG